MASKENQEALEYLKKEMGADFIFSDDNISKCLNTLQKAIDDLELKDKALEHSCNELEYISSKGADSELYTHHTSKEWKEYSLVQAKKELENGK